MAIFSMRRILHSAITQITGVVLVVYGLLQILEHFGQIPQDALKNSGALGILLLLSASANFVLIGRLLLRPHGEGNSAEESAPPNYDYEAIRRVMTDNSVRVLAAFGYGDNLLQSQLLARVHSALKLPSPKIQEKFSAEFRYRLEYLVQLGLLGHSGSEYTLSEHGKRFLREAEDKGQFPRVLLGRSPMRIGREEHNPAAPADQKAPLSDR